MSQIIYPITHLPPVIDIGKQTEKGVTRIGFDVHEWLDDWPGMKFSVRPTRPGETESYFAASEMVGSVVFWLVGAVDTEKPGSGTVEVLGVTEDERKLSFMCRTSIANTNTVTTAEIPEPNQPWVDQVILAGESAKEDAMEAAQSARAAAEDAAQVEAAMKGLNEDFGNSSVFLVTAKNKSDDFPVPYADRTQEEIRAAVAAGKTCVLVDNDGKVYTYWDESTIQSVTGEWVPSIRFMGALNYDTNKKLWYRYSIHVRPDGQATWVGNAVRTATPHKLKLTGAVEATYDGSNAVTVDIPHAGIPSTADPLKQLVTDADGNVAWEDRLAYKHVTTEKGYVYVYQDAEIAKDDGLFLLTAPISSPVAGEFFTVIIGGNEYTSKCVDASALAEGMEAYVFGNTAAMGDELPIENPDPDATYLLMLIPDGMEGIYGMVSIEEEPASLTLTVRSAEEVETTTTDIKKVDRELLDIPTPDMNAVNGEDGFIANRPCWVYKTPDGWVVWDGVTEGKETLSININGTPTLLGYKVCPVPMNEYSFRTGGAFYKTYTYDDEGVSKAGLIVTQMSQMAGEILCELKASTGRTLYYSLNREVATNVSVEATGSSGIYIAADFAAEHPRIDVPFNVIYKPIDVELLPPANVNASDIVYYWRWSPTVKKWAAVTIDQLKADLGLT